MAWTDNVRRFFGNPAPSREGADVTEGVRFIPASANAYGVDLWDCAGFTQSRISGSADPEVAAQFVRLRTSNGDDHRDQPPLNALVTECSLQYPVAGEFQDGPLFKASAMEDKWDVYFFRPCIYFARSWRGDLDYRAAVQFDQGRLNITRIESSGGNDPEFSRRVVDYLVKSHILGAVVPHPLPPELPPVAIQTATFSFAMFGRRCSLGTFADTTLLSASINRGS